MKFIILALVIFSITAQRLTIDDPNYNKYLQKFGTAKNTDGTGAKKFAFTGDIFIIHDTTDVKVFLRYSDTDLFNDAQYFGMVKEDGKPEARQVAVLISSYGNSLQINTQIPFKLQTWQLQLQTISKSNGDIIHSLSLEHISNTISINYKFQLIHLQRLLCRCLLCCWNRSTSVDTAFKPLTQTATAGCTVGQVSKAKADTTLKWCSDATCSKILSTPPDLHLNDQFVLQQTITNKSIEGYYLTGTTVQYVRTGLYKRATPVSVINTTKGQAIIQLKAEIAWCAVKIRVSSVLSTTSDGGRIMLVQTEYDLASEYNIALGITDQIQCIKAEGSDECLTCAEELESNGYPSDSCQEETNNSQQIAFVFLALLLMFLI